MDKTSANANYYAYLLRCWRENAAAPWRATLENPHSGEIIGFASLEQLYQFLERQTGQHNQPPAHSSSQ